MFRRPLRHSPVWGKNEKGLREMGVYFRTSQNTAASVPWWFYLFVVAPFQILYLMMKAVLYAAVAVGVFLMMAGRFARDQWRQHRS
jgi:hypothetical protein